MHVIDGTCGRGKKLFRLTKAVVLPLLGNSFQGQSFRHSKFVQIHGSARELVHNFGNGLRTVEEIIAGLKPVP